MLYSNIVVSFLVTCIKASHTMLRIPEYQLSSYHKTYWKRQVLLKLCRNVKARIEVQCCWMGDQPLRSPSATPWSFRMRLWLLVLGVKPRRWCWIWCQDKEVPYLNLLYWFQECQPTSARYFLLSLKFWGFMCSRSFISGALKLQLQIVISHLQCHCICSFGWNQKGVELVFVLEEEREILQSLSSWADNSFVVSTQSIQGYAVFYFSMLM